MFHQEQSVQSNELWITEKKFKKFGILKSKTHPPTQPI